MAKFVNVFSLLDLFKNYGHSIKIRRKKNEIKEKPRTLKKGYK